MRVGAVVVVLASALACVTTHSALPTEHFENSSGAEGYTGADGGPCWWRLFPHADGGCTLDDDGDERTVACGEEASACGGSVRCDCSQPMDDSFCPGARSVHRSERFDAGAGVEPMHSSCAFTIVPPVLGRCFVPRGHGPGRSLWFASIPRGETRELCFGHVPVTCECATFDVDAGGW